MSDTNETVNVTAAPTKVETKAGKPSPKPATPKKDPNTGPKVFNNHGNQTASVKVETEDGKTDFVTVLPRSRVTLPKGASVAKDYKNPNLRIVS
jgi:hypothetical protein